MDAHTRRPIIPFTLPINTPRLPPPSPFFFFNDTATTEIYTLSLHDALPIYRPGHRVRPAAGVRLAQLDDLRKANPRSEEHTSELQSHHDLVCRLLLEKKKKKKKITRNRTTN